MRSSRRRHIKNDLGRELEDAITSPTNDAFSSSERLLSKDRSDSALPDKGEEAAKGHESEETSLKVARVYNRMICQSMLQYWNTLIIPLISQNLAVTAALSVKI